MVRPGGTIMLGSVERFISARPAPLASSLRTFRPITWIWARSNDTLKSAGPSRVAVATATTATC